MPLPCRRLPSVQPPVPRATKNRQQRGVASPHEETSHGQETP